MAETKLQSLLNDGKLSRRAYSALNNAGVKDLDELEDWKESRLLNIPGVGKATYDEIIKVSNSEGIQLMSQLSPTGQSARKTIRGFQVGLALLIIGPILFWIGGAVFRNLGTITLFIVWIIGGLALLNLAFYLEQEMPETQDKVWAWALRLVPLIAFSAAIAWHMGFGFWLG
jgi:hypothetical protein